MPTGWSSFVVSQAIGGLPMRTAAAVATDIEETRDLLILADAAERWAEGDEHFARLRELSAEYAAIPHPRLPSDGDGHAPPGTARP